MLKLKQNALTVLNKRYLKKNDKGNLIETPEELFYRVASNIALADKIYDKAADIETSVREFYTAMSSLDFLPNSPTLINAGQHLQQLSACFVLPVYDSMDSIFETLKNTAIIHKSGGGTGFSFSRLRPKNDVVKTTNGVSSGPISFMQVFNAATEAIKQGGVRRGANMGILRVDHPDILEFITCKNKNTDLNNFNISVAITQKFMEALAKNKSYDLCNPRDESVVGQLNAREVFNKIVEQAWTNGEPGVIFIDKINEMNTLPQVGVIESTNPCGEQPLFSYESCNLGSINLGRFIKGHDIDWLRLEKIIKIAVHFLDNVIDMNKYPIKQIAEITLANRKIGLGVMGWADLLLYLNIPYGSEESFKLGEKVMKFIQVISHKASEELANKRGAFPNFNKSIYVKPIRNATTTTIAPTGTISIIASASSGIEPLFALVYKRNQCLDDIDMYEVNSYFEYVAHKNGFYSQDLLNKIAKNGSLQSIQGVIPEHIKKLFLTSHDISSEQHVRMQAIFQKFTDNAVSKTVNLPHYANKNDIENIYLLAYKMNCKGITVYRDKSRDIQVLNLMDTTTHIHQNKIPRNRPSRTVGATFLMHTGCGKMYVTVNEDCIGICEVFTQLGKSGGCTSSQAEAISRLVSLSLRAGINKELIIKQLKGIRCPSPTLTKGGTILSCADAVAKALEKYVIHSITSKNSINTNENNMPHKHYQNVNFAYICPQCQECGEMLTFLEGCVTCKSCGYSRCS